MTRITLDDLNPSAKAQVAKALKEGKLEPTPNGVTIIKPDKHTIEVPVDNKPKRRLSLRAPHVIIFWILVATLGYTLLALGWLVGVLGDSIYEIGKRCHDAKWNID